MSIYPTDSPEVLALMAEASSALSQPLPAPKDVFHFASSASLQSALKGLKTGTTSWPIPQPRHWNVGDLSVIMKCKGEPVAVMKTLSLVECKLKDVTEEFALSEDEGTREDYIEGHVRFFQAQGPGDFSVDEVVLCERFEIIYQRRSNEQA